MSNTDLHATKGKDQKKTTASEWAKKEEVYGKINEEVAALMSADDMIIFAPAEDFEYTAPLEDFKKSRQSSP